MKPTITVVRAVGVEFARRKLRPLMLLGSAVAVSLLCLGGWLAMRNAWWWLLEAIFIAGSLLFTLLVIIVRATLGRIEPLVTKTQKQSVKTFVDKLERLAENLQTPQLFILYYIIRDTVRPRPDGFIETVSHDSKELAPEFGKLVKDFS